MKLTLNESQYQQALDIAHRRQAAALKKNRPSAHGYNESDPLKVHLQGCVAELAISLITGQEWHAYLEILNDTPTKPPDVGEHLQVRSTEYLTGHLIVHPGDGDEDLFILVVVRGKNLMLKGWLSGYEAKHQKYWGDKFKNGRPAYFIPQSDLRPCEELLKQFPGAPFIAIAD
jgi:hypothetical protein